MMQTMKISRYQFYALFVLYILGVSPIFYFGSTLGQDSWVVVVISMIGSMLVFGGIYGSIFLLNKNSDSLQETMHRLVGRIVTKIVLIVYGLYFIVVSSFVLRDIGEIIEGYLLIGTPRVLIKLLLFLLILYGVARGIEVIFRTAEIYFVATIGGILIVIVLLLFSDVLELRNLQPVFEHSLGEMMKESVPLFLALPFGELVIFSFLFPAINNRKHVIKTGLLAIFTGGFVLILFNLLTIVTIGPTFASNTKFPFIHVIRLINIANFIQRVDAIFVLIVITGSVFHLFVYGYVIGKSFQYVFNTKSYFHYVYPAGIASVALSYFIGDSNVEYLKVGLEKIPYYLNLPFEIIFPFILLIVAIIRHFMGKKKPPVEVNHVEQHILEQIN